MQVEWWSIIPFVVLLLCIALLPLIPATTHAWESNGVKLLVALACGLPVAAWFVLTGYGSEVSHALVEYVQFIMLLLALFVVSGGIFLDGDIRPTPRNNTLFLAIGGAIASVVGTTGAAMLLIRPLLNTNRDRARRVHTVVFTIFIVANCGGLLTPLGDPPCSWDSCAASRSSGRFACGRSGSSSTRYSCSPTTRWTARVRLARVSADAAFHDSDGRRCGSGAPELRVLRR